MLHLSKPIFLSQPHKDYLQLQFIVLLNTRYKEIKKMIYHLIIESFVK